MSGFSFVAGLLAGVYLTNGVELSNGVNLYGAEQCFLSGYRVRETLVASRGYEAVGSESVEEIYKRCFGAMYKPPVNPYTKN